MSQSAWTALGIPENSDRAAVRRGYAAKLKQTNPEDDPEGFKALRAAYDHALTIADARVRAAERGEDYDDEDDWYDEDYEYSPRAAVFTTTPDTGHPEGTPAAPLPSPENDLLNGRDRDVADFELRMNALADQLTSPWATDETQEATLRAILSSPAMAEIGIRAHAEQWIAGLLADHIPKSDGLLTHAIEAFGWDGASYSQRQSPAVAAILHRIDEWRTIETLTSKGDQYHFAFNALSRPPHKHWRMRLKALNPGVARRVNTLLEYSQWQMPGLRHSFNHETVAWWQDQLSRPRMTFGRLMLAPALFIIILALGAIFDPPAPWGIALIVTGGLAALALPWVHLATVARLAHARNAGFGPALPRWAEDGWIAPVFALPIAVMFVPPSPGWAVVALLIAVLGMQWTQFITSERRATGENIFGWVLTIGVYGFFGFVPFLEQPPETMLALCAAAALVIHARLFAIARLVEIGEPLTDRFNLPGVVAIILLGGSALLSPLQPIFIAGTAFAVAALLVNAMFHGQIGWLRYAARVAIAIAFLGASATSIRDRSDPLPAKGETIEQAVAALKQEQPGFALVEANNPELNGELRAIISQRINGTTTPQEAQQRMGGALDVAYRRMLPGSADQWLYQSLAVELQRRIYYQRSNPAICAGRAEPGDAVLPADLGKLSLANVLMVVGTPPITTPSAGKPITTASVIDRAAQLAVTDRATIVKHLESPRNAERCAARITLLRAILEQPEADVAATVRATHADRNQPGAGSPQG